MDFPKSVPGVGLVVGQFADENPSTGQQGSLIPAVWGNAVTEEILNVIREAGLLPEEFDRSQLVASIKRLISDEVDPLKDRERALGDGQARTIGKAANVTYTNPPTGRAIEVEIDASTIAANGWVSMTRNGVIISTGHAPGPGSVVTARALILPGETWMASFSPSLISGAVIRELS